MIRRNFFRMAAASGLATLTKAQPRAAFDDQTVCRATPEHPRHDHALIFPLSADRLLLVWSEYYQRRPSKALGLSFITDDVGCQISAKVSLDHGRNWSDTITVQENIAVDNVKHPSMLRLPSGEILFFFDVRDFKADDSRVFVKRSMDEGETWSKPKQISPDGGFTLINADHVLQHSSGRIILPVYWSQRIWKAESHFTAYCLYSDDQGHSWKPSSGRMDLPKLGAEEPAIVELKDGSLYAILRNQLGKLHKSRSTDRGDTWSTPEPTELQAPASQSCIRRIPKTGDLMILFNNNYEPNHRLGHQGRRNPLTCAISRDEGKTWGSLKDIENRMDYDSAYPSVTFLHDNAYVTFYHECLTAYRGTDLRLKIYPVDWFYKPA